MILKMWELILKEKNVRNESENSNKGKDTKNSLEGNSEGGDDDHHDTTDDDEDGDEEDDDNDE